MNLRLFNYIIIFLLVSSSSCKKKSGCIDPNAANYVYEAKKDDGSCLYDMSFWINSDKHGPVFIYVDGRLKDSLFCVWVGKVPRCGVDTSIYYNGLSYSCTANVPLVSGNHEVRVEAVDGTIWENTYSLPENCLSVLINAAN